jgi:predicted ATP-dependent endonuclease of OLD family
MTVKHSYINTINLKKYKSVKDLTVDLHPNLNILIGANSSGKTNFLDAIYLISRLDASVTKLNRGFEFSISINKEAKEIYHWSLKSNGEKYDDVEEKLIVNNNNSIFYKNKQKTNDTRLSKYIWLEKLSYETPKNVTLLDKPLKFTVDSNEVVFENNTAETKFESTIILKFYQEILRLQTAKSLLKICRTYFILMVNYWIIFKNSHQLRQ